MSFTVQMNFFIKKLRNPESLAKYSLGRKKTLKSERNISDVLVFDQIILRENIFHSLMHILHFFGNSLAFFLGHWRGTFVTVIWYHNPNKVLDYKAPELGSGMASSNSKNKNTIQDNILYFFFKATGGLKCYRVL